MPEIITTAYSEIGDDKKFVKRINYKLKAADMSYHGYLAIILMLAHDTTTIAVNIGPLSTVDQSLPSNRSARVRICNSAFFVSLSTYSLT